MLPSALNAETGDNNTMKKTLPLFLLLLFLSLKVYALPVLSFKAYKFSYWEQGKGWSKWENSSVPIVLQDQGNGVVKLYIYSEAYQEFTIKNEIYSIDKSDTIDSRYEAIDIDRIPCEIIIQEEKNYTMIYIQYLNIMYGYKTVQN